MLHNVMISSLRDARRCLIYILSKHVERSRYASINHRLFATRNQRVPSEDALNCRYNPCTFFAQGAVRGIATNSITAPRRVFIPSTKQQAIVDLCRTQNVVVSARPGAGKTATAEAIAAADPNRRIAIITYSKRLQLDTVRRLDAYPWSDVFTFHGLAGRLFSTVVYNDSILHSLREQGNIPDWAGEPYEIIILDEMQDCTDDLFWLICIFISAVTRRARGRIPQIVVLGDERQAIYGFRGADSRYLSLSSSIMTTLSPYPWSHLALSKSFRLSYENSKFVNNVFLEGEQYIAGSHHGPKPLYLYGNVFDIKSIAQHLVPLIHQYGPECTAIIAPNVRQNKLLSSLTNHLSEVHSIPIAVSISDDVPLDDKVLRGKICVSTYHQFKGNERDLVIIYGANDNYFDFYARDLPDNTCPNTTFVALTRACKHLVMVHHYEDRPMPFVDVAELYKTAEFVCLRGYGKMQKSKPPSRPQQLGLFLPRSVSVSDLPRYVLDEVISDICARHLQIIHTLPSLSEALNINAPSIVLTDPIRKHHEAVSDLNGLAVVAAYEYALLGTLNTLGKFNGSLLEIPSDTQAQAIWLCREACEYEAQMSGYKSRSLQMKEHSFDWLELYLDAAKKRLEAQFPKTATLDFEVELSKEEFKVLDPLDDRVETTSVYGRADIIRYEGTLGSTSSAETDWKKEKRGVKEMDLDNVSIWEIKFVSQLSLQHVIQVCIYAYLWCNKHERDVPPRIILFNVRNREKWEIVPRHGVASLRGVLEDTLIAKYTTKHTLSTDEFLEKCAKTKAEVEKSCEKAG